MHIPTVPRKWFGSADCDTIYIIYKSFCTQTADPNHFWGTHCMYLLSILYFKRENFETLELWSLNISFNIYIKWMLLYSLKIVLDILHLLWNLFLEVYQYKKEGINYKKKFVLKKIEDLLLIVFILNIRNIWKWIKNCDIFSYLFLNLSEMINYNQQKRTFINNNTRGVG